MIIDLHQDISIKLLDKGVNSFLCAFPSVNKINTYGNYGLIDQIDYQRLIKGKYRVILGASCALNLDQKGISVPKNPLKTLLTHLCSYANLADKSLGKIKLIKNVFDLKNLGKKQIGIILSVEGLYCLKKEEDFKIVDRLYKFGVRSIAPLWNLDNPLGGGISTSKRLTTLGKNLIEYLNFKKIIIDGSHLNPHSLHQILALSSSPIIVSHALSKTVYNHSRNLDDKDVKTICGKGGLIGICFVSEFNGTKNLDGLIAHVKHLTKVGSINNISIGSDFGAMERQHLIKNLEDASKIVNFERVLRKAGLSSDGIEKILWKNAFKFLENHL